MTELRLRQAARAVVLDPDDRILLVRFEFPDTSFWATPGGGVEAGETHEDALARELLEEAGLEDIVLGPCIWTRTHIVPFESGLWDGQVERYFLLRTECFEPAPRLTVEQLAAEWVSGIRWWTQGELAAAGGRKFAPRRLPELVAALVRDGPPGEPLDVGV
jgi:ADP-ribose pyrophosphatase YjhB (NUDIX family)